MSDASLQIFIWDELFSTYINYVIFFQVRCGNKQSGELGTSSEAVDGILGFGQANSSLLSQLASSGKVKKEFAHCLDNKKGGGIFAIGEVVEPKVDMTPLVPNQYVSHLILLVFHYFELF